jgi:hypothetical protein
MVPYLAQQEILLFGPWHQPVIWGLTKGMLQNIYILFY